MMLCVYPSMQDASGNSSGVVKAIVDKWKELILSDTSTVQGAVC